MSLAMEGMGDMDGIGESMRSANGKQCSEKASVPADRSLGVLMERNLALAEAVDAMYPGTRLCTLRRSSLGKLVLQVSDQLR